MIKAIDNIYLAGKIESIDWRHDIVSNLRERFPQSGEFEDYSTALVNGLAKPWPILTNSIFGRYHYTGPYFINSGGIGTFHGENTHGVGANSNCTYDEDNAEEKHHNTPIVEMRPWVVERCQLSIQKSDLVFAWIDDITCYGTIAEIGYAKALGKIVWIATPKRYHDLWFVFQMVDQVEFIHDWLRHPIQPKDILKGMLHTYEREHTRFDSPIEQAFWEAWHGHSYETRFTLTPQHPIGKYRVDFAHIPSKCAIELDGHATHSSPEAIAKDRKRQRYIEEQGWHVIRFGGKEVYNDAGACAFEAFRHLNLFSSKNPKALMETIKSHEK